MHTLHSRSTFTEGGRWYTLVAIGISLVCGWAANAAAGAPAAGVKSGPRSTPGVPIDTGTPWWQHAVIYEIYPRSFQDSNADGSGDLNGITQRLGYLESLGVDAIWIAPFYPSPQVDFGYDISDYESIDPTFGT